MSEMNWNDAHFCNLPSHNLLYSGLTCGVTTTPQTNVYAHSKMIDPDGSNKFLVASRVGKITSLEYQIVMDKLAPSTKIIPFSYIPAGAELVSLDVISKSAYHRRILVGITFIKFEEESDTDTENTFKQYLNLYSLREEYSGFDNIDDSFCQSIELDFVPYQLTHTSAFIEGKLESVFLLGGSDNRIHMYREESSVQQSFSEFPTPSCFPEFEDIATCVHWIDIVYFHQFSKRLTARGHRDGCVVVTYVDVNKNEIVDKWSLQHDSPVTSVKIFTFENTVSKPAFLNYKKETTKESGEDPLYHVLVLSALEPAAVYRNILSVGLKDPLVLPQSNRFDIPLCVCIVDIDFDGYNEILVGTYGQELLAYKFMTKDKTVTAEQTSDSTECEENESIDPNRNRHRSDEKNQTANKDIQNTIRSKSHENLTLKQAIDDPAIKQDSHKTVINKSDHFKLIWQKGFACPVMGVDSVDIMGDGMEDLIVVTLKGVHIIQPDLHEIAKVCLERMNLLTRKKEKQEDEKTLSNNKNGEK